MDPTEPVEPSESDADSAPQGAVDTEAPVPSMRAPSRSMHSPRPRRRLRLALASCTIVAAPLLGYGIYQWLRDPVFPLDNVGSLPEDAVGVRRFRSAWFANGFPNFPELRVDQALWSRMAHDVCGGPDLYADLMNVRYGASGKHRVAQGLADPRVTSQALQCGKDISRKVGKRAFDVRLPDPTNVNEGSWATVNVQLVELRLSHGLAEKTDDDLPPPKGLDELVCGTNTGGPVICLPTMSVVGRLAGTKLYAVGALEDVERLAAGFSQSGDNKLARSEDLAALADDVAPYRTAEVETHRPFTRTVLTSLGIAYDVALAFQSSDAEKRMREALESTDAIWAFGDSVGSDGGEASLWFRAARDADVPALLSAVTAWRVDVGAFLTATELKQYKDFPDVDRKFFEAIHKMGIESFRAATIERKGRDVVIRLVRVVPDAALLLVADMRKEIATRSRSAARVVDTALRGDPFERRDLEAIGGLELANEVEATSKAGAKVPAPL